MSYDHKRIIQIFENFPSVLKSARGWKWWKTKAYPGGRHYPSNSSPCLSWAPFQRKFRNWRKVSTFCDSYPRMQHQRYPEHRNTVWNHLTQSSAVDSVLLRVEFYKRRNGDTSERRRPPINFQHPTIILIKYKHGSDILHRNPCRSPFWTKLIPEVWIS